MVEQQNSLNSKITNIIREDFENMLSLRGTSVKRFDTSAGQNSGEYIGKGIQMEWVAYLLYHTSSGKTMKPFDPIFSTPLKFKPDVPARNRESNQPKQKKIFECYDSAYLASAIDAERYCKPFWIYKNNEGDGYMVSSRGYSTENAPASIPSDNRVEMAQIEHGYPMFDSCKIIIPSGAIRLAYNGRVFSQLHNYFKPEKLFFWISQNVGSAVFINFPKINQPDRVAQMASIRNELLKTWGLHSFYRWMSRDCVLLGVRPVNSLESAKWRTVNAHFLKNALQSVNTPIPEKLRVSSAR